VCRATIVSLQASGADVLLTAAIPRMVAQTIRKVYEIGWKPLHVVLFAGANIPVVLKPAGLEKSVGIVSAAWIIQPVIRAGNTIPTTRPILLS
jgi:branched-chain amino acid transport system substrate-binding protein